MGKTEGALAQERQYFLDLFMKKCCEYRYIAVSSEMQIFLRPNGDIEKLLSNVPKPRTNDLLGMYRILVPVNENYQNSEVDAFTKQVNIFITEQKTQHKELAKFKDALKVFVPMKQQQVQFYHTFHQFLKSYEDLQDKEANVAGELKHIRLLKANAQGLDLKANLEKMTAVQKNSFLHIRNWVKGEIL